MARYARWVTVFLISGCMHFLIDISAGIPANKSGALMFFCTQILGMAIEDMIIKIYSYLTARAETRKLIPIERVNRLPMGGLIFSMVFPSLHVPDDVSPKYGPG